MWSPGELVVDLQSSSSDAVQQLVALVRNTRRIGNLHRHHTCTCTCTGSYCIWHKLLETCSNVRYMYTSIDLISTTEEIPTSAFGMTTVEGLFMSQWTVHVHAYMYIHTNVQNTGTWIYRIYSNRSSTLISSYP